jgi:hypothetical protein
VLIEKNVDDPSCNVYEVICPLGVGWSGIIVPDMADNNVETTCVEGFIVD